MFQDADRGNVEEVGLAAGVVSSELLRLIGCTMGGRSAVSSVLAACAFRGWLSPSVSLNIISGPLIGVSFIKIRFTTTLDWFVLRNFHRWALGHAFDISRPDRTDWDRRQGLVTTNRSSTISK